MTNNKFIRSTIRSLLPAPALEPDQRLDTTFFSWVVMGGNYPSQESLKKRSAIFILCLEVMMM
jgi:hypothetical protein